MNTEYGTGINRVHLGLGSPWVRIAESTQNLAPHITKTNSTQFSPFVLSLHVNFPLKDFGNSAVKCQHPPSYLPSPSFQSGLRLNQSSHISGISWGRLVDELRTRYLGTYAVPHDCF